MFLFDKLAMPASKIKIPPSISLVIIGGMAFRAKVMPSTVPLHLRHTQWQYQIPHSANNGNFWHLRTAIDAKLQTSHKIIHFCSAIALQLCSTLLFLTTKAIQKPNFPPGKGVFVPRCHKEPSDLRNALRCNLRCHPLGTVRSTEYVTAHSMDTVKYTVERTVPKG